MDPKHNIKMLCQSNQYPLKFENVNYHIGKKDKIIISEYLMRCNVHTHYIAKKKRYNALLYITFIF